MRQDSSRIYFNSRRFCADNEHYVKLVPGSCFSPVAIPVSGAREVEALPHRHPPRPARRHLDPGPAAADAPARPGTWQQALTGVLGASPGRADNRPGHPAVETAIYPDVVWLAARSLRR
jgi:hypothetical protein